ncbi:MAG: hypothetical protein QOG63_1354 [Thermoleophilaceae bacterium]|jgi:hypothetical protein|nr:hypothetical protein [Thermoleophilaceae bacterium]
MGEETQGTTPDEQLRQLFGQAEKTTANAMEELVQRDSFGEILARVTENVMGLTKIGFGVLDMTVRNLRIAGRADLIRVGRQLARNEDKLERVLQEVERLQDEVRELAQEQKPQRSQSRSNGSSSTRRKSSSSTKSNGRSRSSSSSSK